MPFRQSDYCAAVKSAFVMIVLLGTLLWSPSACACASSLSPLAQDVSETAERMRLAFDAGDNSSICALIGSSVELQMPDASGIFSKKQAEMIIGKFLSLHPGLLCAVDQEEATPDATLVIGSLSGGSDLFRFYLLLQPTDGSLQIKQLRIETQK